MKKLLALVLQTIRLPILVLIICSAITALYGTALLGSLGYRFITEELFRDPKLLVTEFLTIVDMFLLSVMQYIFAAGLYQLFIGNIELPEWLGIESIDRLKAALASIIILFLAVFFAQQAVKLQNPIEVLYLGAGIAMVIAALVLYYKVKTSQ